MGVGIALRPAPGQTGDMAEEQSGITVVGVGTVRVPTTEAQVGLRIERREAQPGAALREAAAVVAAALDVQRDTGAPDADVRTEAVSVAPHRVWANNTEQVQGYDAGQTLRVRLTDLGLLDRLLGALVDRCGTGLQIEDVSLSAEPTADALSRARREAIDDARQKASDYATFSGRALGSVESISEVTGVHRPVPRARMEMAAAAASMPIAQGEQAATVTVEVHWQLE